MIRYSFTTPRSAPSKANTDPKSTLWNLWSFWVFKSAIQHGHARLPCPLTPNWDPQQHFAHPCETSSSEKNMWDCPGKSAQNLLVLMLLFLLSSLLLLPLFLDLTFQHLVLFCGVNIQVTWWSYVPKVRYVYQSHFTTKVSLPVS